MVLLDYTGANTLMLLNIIISAAFYFSLVTVRWCHISVLNAMLEDSFLVLSFSTVVVTHTLGSGPSGG